MLKPSEETAPAQQAEPPMSTVERPSITAFFPAYNDSPTIASMVVVADATLRTLTDRYEIIVVNDGSPDHCAEILNELALRYPRLKLVVHETNRGYGGALKSGFSNATQDLVFYTDGDAQYDPRELAALLKAMTDDVDIVNGYKIERHDPLYRRALGWLYNGTVRIAFGLRLRDVHCDFRLIRRRALRNITLTSDSGAIGVELSRALQDAGCRLAEVPVSHYARPCGVSQFFSARRIFQTIWDLAGLWHAFFVAGRRAGVSDLPPGHPAPTTVGTRSE